jgi:chromosome segregation ATPase
MLHEQRAQAEAQAQARAAAEQQLAQERQQAQEARDALAGAQGALAASQGRAHDLQAYADSLSARLSESGRALNVAVRTQAMREADLQDLRERHAALSQQQRETQELLHKLAERLTVAQRHYAQLRQADPDGSRPPAVGQRKRKPRKAADAALALAADPAPRPAPASAARARAGAAGGDATSGDPRG